jgi:phage portal protein BeeE
LVAEANQTIALAVAEYRFRNDTAKAVAERYGVTEQTLGNWRKRVDAAPDKEPALAELYRAAMASLLEGWRSQTRRFLVAAWASLEADLPEMEPMDKIAAIRLAMDAELRGIAIARRTGITTDEAPAYPPPEKRLDS